jgi:catechol 2,3-dioxygenase-like lactoylglutathione lyase family enzyme
MDHVGIVVEDLEAAIAFFVELGLELRGQGSVGGDWVDRAIALEDVRADIAMLGTPDGQVRLELSQFHSPAAEGGEPEPSNRLGIRHLSFLVEDLDDVFARLRTQGAELVGEIETYRDVYRLCYLRGPAGIIVELAEEVG